MSTENIPQLPTDHHHAVDWARVRRATLLRHPLKTTATAAAGAALGPWWTTNAALPLLGLYGPQAPIGLAFMTGIYAGVVATNGKVRPLVRRAAAAVLVAAVTGTLYAAPVRNAIIAWLLEN
ncbi:hypothetical protein [Kitasatospora sp. NBC_00458]|uniref:hypothetical protein n=1 Tax=Kitasatospora sp. NBC_00458 TaxID=2903568 RepID=UPI002E183C7F